MKYRVVIRIRLLHSRQMLQQQHPLTCGSV